MRHRPSCLRAATAVAALLALAACSIHSRTHWALEKIPGPSPRSACVLFVDGLSADAFGRLLAAGALPNLKKELVDRALVFDTAVTSVPSETYPNLTAMLTGLFPGHHGIPANVWLDRRLRLREAHTNIFRSYSASDFLVPEARTLFERLPADTVAVNAPVARGVTVHNKNIVAIGASYMRNDWSFLERKTLDDVGDAYAGAVTTGRLPSLVWAHFLGPDEVAHSDGPESAAFRAELEAVDRAFARLVRRLKRRKIYDRVLFVLVGDHGNSTYSTYVNAEELVHRALFSHPTQADCARGHCVILPAKGSRERSFDVGDALIAVGAYRGVMIWLPGNRPPEDVPNAFRTRKKKRLATRPGVPRPPTRPMPPRSEFAAVLARMPEIELVVTRGAEPGEVAIYGRAGRSVIAREEHVRFPPTYTYRLIEGADPLGYAAVPELLPLLGRPLAADEWISRTADTEYPDLVVQLAEFFDATRAPDVYLSPRDGFGFRDGRAGGHGALSRREMVVPLLFAGPGVVPGHRPTARTLDVAPTLLRYLGIAFDPSEMDGDDLAIVTREPVPLPPIPAGEGSPDGGDD